MNRRQKIKELREQLQRLNQQAGSIPLDSPKNIDEYFKIFSEAAELEFQLLDLQNQDRYHHHGHIHSPFYSTLVRKRDK